MPTMIEPQAAMDPIGAPDLLDEALCRATFLLGRLGYSNAAITRIVDHGREHGSFDCLNGVNDLDRQAVEAMLPASSAWESAEWDEHYWSTTD
jgi:hypothetical protein